MNEENKSLFHYTSNEGAIGIISSANLHATNYKYLNDSYELKISRDFLVPKFAADFETEAHKLIAEGLGKQSYLEDKGKNFCQQEARKLFDIIVRKMDFGSPVFITSFCRHDYSSGEWHHGLLSQWRAYGARGGCALEFDQTKLGELLRDEENSFAYTHISVRKVDYEKHEMAFDQNEIGTVAGVMLRLLIDNSEQNQRLYREKIEKLYDAIAVVGPTLKKASFREEQEVRIIAPLMRLKSPEAIERRPREIFFKYRGGLPVPYIKLLDGVQRLPITRIIVGPQRDQDKVCYALQLALEAKKMECQVTASEISYLPN